MMKLKSLKLLTAGVLGMSVILSLGISAKQVNANNSETRFICADSYDSETRTSVPTTFAWTNRGKIAIVRWLTKDFADAGFTPQQRCDEISPRFQEAYDNNSLNLITNGKINNQPVICTSNQPGGACNTLLMTLRPEDDSLKMLNNLQRVFNGEQVGITRHNGNGFQAYYQVDIENFLETAPVE